MSDDAEGRGGGGVECAGEGGRTFRILEVRPELLHPLRHGVGGTSRPARDAGATAAERRRARGELRVVLNGPF
jgi:hypothetical protein